ncbi:MAG: thioredoxin family protein [Bacteroidia bacterium]|nr:thioredoxin family protein [Bacteroidia bacterium]
MKTLSIITLITFLFGASFNKTIQKKDVNSEIIFENISFKNALQKAKQENKLLFVNVYAVWCAPCKELKNKTFKSSKVADAVNARFINLDINAEEGEGIDFSKKYKVTAHPLVLIIDATGKEKKRILGYRNDTQLLSELNEFLPNNNN